MQTLYFEDAWNRTLSDEDREKITAHFENLMSQNDVIISFLWEAVNHQNEKLVTVLIHNPTSSSLDIHNTPIANPLSNGKLTISSFSIPVPIPAKTSMPWTLIFNENNYTENKPRYTITRSHA